MRNTSTTATFLFLCLFAIGQLDLPFPNSEAWWTQTRYIPADPASSNQTPTEYTYVYFNIGWTDTIEGMEYYRLYTSLDIDNPSGHYRIDGNKVYYREDYADPWFPDDQHGTYTTGEYVLYDFDLQVGDTFNLAPGDDVILETIDSIQIGSEYYRKFNFNLYTYLESPQEYYWIEGIGSNIGFYPYFRYFENFLFFDCFAEDTISYFPPNSPCLLWGTTELDFDFKVFPNPVSDYLTIEVRPLFDQSASIYDIHGTCVQHFEVKEPTTKIDLRQLQAGVYFVQINERIVRFLKN